MSLFLGLIWFFCIDATKLAFGLNFSAIVGSFAWVRKYLPVTIKSVAEVDADRVQNMLRSLVVLSSTASAFGGLDPAAAAAAAAAAAKNEAAENADGMLEDRALDLDRRVRGGGSPFRDDTLAARAYIATRAGCIACVRRCIAAAWRCATGAVAGVRSQRDHWALALSGMLFAPMISQHFAVLHCSYVETAPREWAAVLVHDGATACWDGAHFFWVFGSFLFIGAFVPSAMVLGPLYANRGAAR